MGKIFLKKNNPISNPKDSSKELSDCTISNREPNKEDIKNEYEKSAQYSYNIVNTISGIATPLFSLLAVIAAFWTLYRQRKQNELEEFENHLFQMIDQQHKLEDKIIDKHGSFRELYEQFCEIFNKVDSTVDNNVKIKKGGNELKDIKMQLAYYIFYFGADPDFICDNTGEEIKKKLGVSQDFFTKLNEIKQDLINAENKFIDIFSQSKIGRIRYLLSKSI